MSGLNQKDIEILKYYSEQGSRERYWNYLAQHEGADGYGLLALGVVRNDNMPGAVANAYAQSYARSRNGVVLSERQWEDFGQALVRQDFSKRLKHFDLGQTGLALNLPASDIQEAHKATFAINGIDADAWTPNRLIDAARRKGGEAAVESVWHTMMDSDLRGVTRMAKTTRDISVSYNETFPDSAGYLWSLTQAEFNAARTSPASDPDHIQRGIEHYEYNRRDRTWTVYADSDVAEFGFRTPTESVRDKATIESLNDAREVRLERQAKSQQVHPDDVHRTLATSPHTIADNGQRQPGDQMMATGRSIDPALYDDLKQRFPAGLSEDRLAQVTLAARQADIRGGEVSGISMHGDNVLQVHGARPGDRAMVDVSLPPPPVQQSVQQAQVYERDQAVSMDRFHFEQAQVEQVAQQQQMQRQQAVSQSGPSMGPRMG